jgi:Cd2+/Zn2+-exporting ATPase
VASLEARSNHPLAKAILKYAGEKGVIVVPAENYQIIQGKGATALFDGRTFWLGSHRYLEERCQETPEMHEKLEQMSASGHTVVVIGNEQHVCGMIAISDEVREESSSVIAQLRKSNIQHIAMLTGDNQGTARAIAKLTGVDEVYAELLPEDKVNVLENITQKYGKTAMVGDGVNDAPAMARASVGIAMGAVGSDAAIETADIALMADDLTRLPWLIKLSRFTLLMIRQNTAFSLAIKLLFVILTFSGYAYLWAAIAADTGASLLVIFNSLRILKVSPLISKGVVANDH